MIRSESVTQLGKVDTNTIVKRGTGNMNHNRQTMVVKRERIPFHLLVDDDDKWIDVISWQESCIW